MERGPFIRPLRPQDLGICSAIIHDCIDYVLSERAGGYMSDELIGQLKAKFTPEGLKRLMKEREFLVAEVGGHVSGLISFSREAVVFRKERYIQLYNLYVHPESEEAGIGRSLLSAAMKPAMNRDVVGVFCHATLTTHDFYMRLGFTHLPEEDVYLEGVPAPEWQERYRCSHMREMPMCKRLNCYFMMLKFAT